MNIVNSTDILRKPALLSSKEVLYIEDGRKHELKSVLIPVELYELIREQFEEALYLRRNTDALSLESYENFSEIESVAGDLG